MSLIFINSLVQASHDMLLRTTAGLGINTVFIEAIFIALVAASIFQVFALYAIFGGWLERKLIARSHTRIGPMYVGKFGLLQTIADALKFLKKETIYPNGSDRLLYFFAPIVMIITPFLATIFLPLGSFTLIESQYSLLIVLALLSLSPIAILMGAWASNSKYSTLGGLRAAGMTIAYEVLLALSVASVILATHSLSINEIVNFQHQTGVWLIILQPTGFILFLIAGVASVERNPFDLTEAESELVSGWKTEYGAVLFSFTLLAEYIKLLVSVILITCLFLGGWLGPLGEVGFILKIIVLTFFMIYVRATALRLRIDQLLNIVWARLVPIAILNFIITVGVLIATGGIHA